MLELPYVPMSALATNKRATFDYEILDTIEAGLVLTGQEVKSVKQGHMSLAGSFVTFHKKDALLTNARISPYPQAGPLPSYDPTASRRLLLRKKEINYLRGKSLQKGLTIIPLKVYTKNRFIKIEVAVARGRHTYDKREVIKKREVQREIRRAQK